jgi:hypothetical protein
MPVIVLTCHALTIMRRSVGVVHRCVFARHAAEQAFGEQLVREVLLLVEGALAVGGEQRGDVGAEPDVGPVLQKRPVQRHHVLGDLFDDLPRGVRAELGVAPEQLRGGRGEQGVLSHGAGEGGRPGLAEQVGDEDELLALVARRLGSDVGDSAERGSVGRHLRREVGHRAVAAEPGDGRPPVGEPLHLGGRLPVQLVEQLVGGLGIVEHVRQRGEREAEPGQPGDPQQPDQVAHVVVAVAVDRAFRFVEDADLEVVPHSTDGDTGKCGQFTAAQRPSPSPRSRSGRSVARRDIRMPGSDLDALPSPL